MAAALAVVGDASAQTPTALTPNPPRPRAGGGAARRPDHTHGAQPRAHRVRRGPPPPGYAAVTAANAQARAYATPDAYINAVLYYDYEAGRIYTLQTSPRFLTAVLLRPGEKLIAKAAGDTVRWVLGETVQGSGANQQVVVLIKPIRGGLKTNVVLTTDQRTYLLEAVSREGGTYTSAISWNYPQEQMQALAAAQAAQAQSVVAPTLAIDQLHFDYKVEAIHMKAPRWQPLRVFDDGLKTYIQFPVNMAATDAPPLFPGRPGRHAAQLVNYRYLNGYYVATGWSTSPSCGWAKSPSRSCITRTAEG